MTQAIPPKVICAWQTPLPDQPSEATGSATEGFVHSVETCGSVDGPGLRYVVFLAGCAMRCQYCHNPDTQGRPRGTRRSAGSIVMDALRYHNFILKGGGITVSGGEPLVQAGFTKAILEKAKQSQLHTALDTSGFLGDQADDDLLAATDLVLLDIKSGLPETHRVATGVDIDPVLRFARRLQTIGKATWIRFVLVPGLTDEADNLVATARIIGTLDNCERVEILPFHQYGKAKYAALGMTYALENTHPATDDDLSRAWDIFLDNGVGRHLNPEFMK